MNEILNAELGVLRDAFPGREIDQLRARYVVVAAEDHDGGVYEWVLPQKSGTNIQSLRKIFPEAAIRECFWANFFTLYYNAISPFEAKALTAMSRIRLTCYDQNFDQLGWFVIRPSEVLS